ncbi:MAG TPA: hypothetical protein QGF35_01880 [Dehalococcoidia bacterium]|nr:hypothetical protein [Dehalococcoidia bacterium]
MAADGSTCAAKQLAALDPPSESYRVFDDAMDTALAEYIDGMRVGRQAAEQRNVSKLREWLTTVDRFGSTMQSVRLSLPTR